MPLAWPEDPSVLVGLVKLRGSALNLDPNQAASWLASFLCLDLGIDTEVGRTLLAEDPSQVSAHPVATEVHAGAVSGVRVLGYDLHLRSWALVILLRRAYDHGA